MIGSMSDGLRRLKEVIQLLFDPRDYIGDKDAFLTVHCESKQVVELEVISATRL
jgi:hypothetical protein